MNNIWSIPLRVLGIVIKIPRIRSLIDKLLPALSLFIGMLSRASGQVVALVITLVAARYLTPSDFGVYAIAAAIVTIIRTLLYSATFQHIMQTPTLELYSTECLVVSLLMVAACSVAPFVILLALPGLFGSSVVLTLFLWMAPSNLICAFTAWSEAQVLRSGKVSRYYAATAITEVASGALAVALFMGGLGIMSFVPMVYVRAIALLGAYGWIQKPAMSKGFSLKRCSEIARWSMPLYGSTLTSLFSTYGADFMIGAILSPAAAGLYRAASRITTAVSDLCTQPMSLIATTIFARRRSSGRNANDLWPAMVALSLFITLPGLGGLAAVADLILPSLLGRGWANLAAIVAVLSLGRVMASMGGVAGPFLIAHGHHKLLLPVQIASAACLLVGLLIFARYGIQATAIVTAVSVSLSAAAYLGLSYYVASSPFNTSIRLLTLAALPGIVSTAAATMVVRSSIVTHPILLASLAISLAIILWLIAVLLLRRGLGTIFHPLRASENLNRVETTSL